ncbi:MAG: cytochrome c [Proteobacteria bacterium]|nr:cytochrome c [Pseudomonadota bacterium]
MCRSRSTNKLASKSNLQEYIVGAVILALTVIWVTVMTPDPTLLAAQSQTNSTSNPVSGDAASIKQGKRLYRGMCARCHGRKGEGGGRFARSSNLREYSRGYTKFAVIVKDGSKKMPAWGGILSSDDINKIGAFLETLALDDANWQDPS